MTVPGGSLLIVGIGNILLRDDGVGIAVVREIERRAGRGDLQLPDGTALVDGGTLGLGLLPLVAEARAIVLVDAVDRGREPGALEVLRGAELVAEAAGGGRSGAVRVSRGGLGDLLVAARLAGTDPAAIALVGIQPAEIAVGLELTAAVRKAVSAAAEIVVDEARRLAASPPVTSSEPAPRRQDAVECAA
jgi:hydrogenase maturation protease